MTANTASMDTMSWSDQGTSIRFDLLGLALALALHAPLLFIRFDARKKATDMPGERLVAVDLVTEESLKKPVEAIVPAPPPAPAESNLMSRLRQLVHREPPPPPAPVKKEEAPPAKVDLGPKAIDLKPNLSLPAPVQAKLETKSGFQTTANPALIEKKIALNAGGPALAPLSAQRLGTVDDRQTLKSSKNNFQIKTGDAISGIGGGPKIADPTAPAIAIRTGAVATRENFTAPATQKNKGSFGGTGAGPGLVDDPNLSLRDRMIMRDAAPSAINTGPRGGVGDLTGGAPIGTKRDAGRSFQTAGVPNGINGGVIGGTGSGPASGSAIVQAVAPLAAKKKQTPSMFVIQGALKDRQIEHQEVPEYPAWAQDKGIEGSVVLEFTVEPDGTVKSVISVKRTSGYTKLDESAIAALRRWKFVALSGNENREEVGLITFNYSLN